MCSLKLFKIVVFQGTLSQFFRSRGNPFHASDAAVSQLEKVGVWKRNELKSGR
jgi:hypothetical protein